MSSRVKVPKRCCSPANLKVNRACLPVKKNQKEQGFHMSASRSLARAGGTVELVLRTQPKGFRSFKPLRVAPTLRLCEPSHVGAPPKSRARTAMAGIMYAIALRPRMWGYCTPNARNNPRSCSHVLTYYTCMWYPQEYCVRNYPARFRNE